MAVKYLAGNRLTGTDAERTGMTVNAEYTATPDSTPNNFAAMTLDGSSTPEVLTQSITEVSNSVFYCRFKVVFGSYGTNSYSFVSLTDTTARSNESINSLGVLFRNDSGGNKWGVHTIAGATMDSVNGQDLQTYAFASDTAYYFEIIRETSGKAFVINYGTDSTYQTKVSTSETCSVSSSCTGLKYVGVRDHASSNSNSTITVTDVKIYSSDSLESSADGTNVNATLDTTNEKLGSGCLSFNGTNAILQANALKDSMTTTGTISMWVRITDTISNQDSKVFWCFGDTDANEFILAKIDDGRLRAVCRDAGTNAWDCKTSAGTITQNNWHHIVITHNGTTPILYVDGSADTTFTVTTDKTKWLDDLSGVDNFRIFGQSFNGDGDEQFPTGQCDDFAIWNTALPATGTGSVASLWNSTNGALANTIPIGLRVYYNCDSTTLNNDYNIPLGNNPSADIYASQGGANEGYYLSRDGGEDWRFGSTSTATSGGSGKNIRYVKFGIKKTGTFSDDAKFECVIMDGNGNSPTNESTNVVATGTLVSQTGMTITGSPTQLVGSMFDSSDWVWVKWQFDNVELLNSYRIVFRAMTGVITSNSNALHLNWTSGACGSGGVQSADGWNYSASSSGTPQNTWGTSWKINMLALTGTTTYPDLPNGTTFLTSDTNKLYMWDGTDTWNEVS